MSNPGMSNPGMSNPGMSNAGMSNAGPSRRDILAATATGLVLPGPASAATVLEAISAVQHGVVADAGADGRGGRDNAAALQAAIDAANGRPVALPPGAIRLGGPLARLTSGDAQGLTLVGQGRGVTTLWCDFDGPRAILVDGSSREVYRFQASGGLSHLALRAVRGRRIGAGLEAVGWLKACHHSLFIAGFDHGVYTPARPDIDANADAYATVEWHLQDVEIRECENGVRMRSGQGSASWTFLHCRIELNRGDGIDCDGADGLRVHSSSLSFNGIGGRGYGVRVNGATSSVTNVELAFVELDGNRSGGAYYRNVLNVSHIFNRHISRRFSGADAGLRHVVVDPAGVMSHGEFRGNFHRIDQQPERPGTPPLAGAILLYDFGDGSARNIYGAQIVGYRVLDSGPPTSAAPGVSITHASRAITDPRYRNRLTEGFGLDRVATRTSFCARLEASQGWTTALTALAGTGVAATGWEDQYDAATGGFTMPHNGAVRVQLQCGADNLDSDETFRVVVRVGDSVARDWQESVAALPAPGRKALTFLDDIAVSRGQIVRVEVATLRQSRAIWGSFRLNLMAV